MNDNSKKDIDPKLLKFKDRLWRLNHLYYIQDKNGKKVKFKMTREQLDYYIGMHNRNIILKARQLGFTTEVCIIQLDAALFEHKHCALIAHTLHDAKRLFRNKVKYAYDNLPSLVKDANPLQISNTDEYVFTKGGSITVSTSFRGGTLQMLHISEFGKICAKFPQKAQEIVTGAFEAVAINGKITLESTAEGRSGYFFEFTQDAQKLLAIGKKLSRMDWKFFFFSWHQNKEYIDTPTLLPDTMVKYFKELKAKYSIDTSPEQQAWYYSKYKVLGDDIKREYPSTPKEAFETTIEGAYYSSQFTKAYSDGRMVEELEVDNRYTVNTYWDLGVGDATSIWFIQKVAGQYRVIDYYENSGEGLAHYFKVLKEKTDTLGYRYGKHYAPHDIDARRFGETAKSLKQIASEGVEIDEIGTKYSLQFVTVDRTRVETGIEAVRNILAKCVFNVLKCDVGVTALESYRKEFDAKAGTYKDNPLHDWSSHASDAFRYFAVAESGVKYVTSTKPRKKQVSMY